MSAPPVSNISNEQDEKNDYTNYVRSPVSREEKLQQMRVGTVNKTSFLPAPKKEVTLNKKLSLAPYHQYEYQKVNSSEGRFLYDGALPKINSKYRKQSVDIDISKFTQRGSEALISPRSPASDKLYDVKFDLVTHRTADAPSFKPRRFSD